MTQYINWMNRNDYSVARKSMIDSETIGRPSLNESVEIFKSIVNGAMENNDIKSCYDISNHNKIHSTRYKSNNAKSIAIFTKYKTHNVCIFIGLCGNERPRWANIIPCQFNSKHLIVNSGGGTILWGEMSGSHTKGNGVFEIHDVVYGGHGINVNTLFSRELVGTIGITNNMCIFAKRREKCPPRAPPLLPHYPLPNQPRCNYSIPPPPHFPAPPPHPSTMTKPPPPVPKKSKGHRSNTSFLLRASVFPDVYKIVNVKSKSDARHIGSSVVISNYKTSVKMNKKFRTIRENDNLDNIQESDDEEDFENVSNTKNIIPNKELWIDCSYNTKFKKWAVA